MGHPLRQSDGVLCQCGCGGVVNLDRKKRPCRFLPGHYSRTQAHRDVVASIDPERTRHVGAANGFWKGGRSIDAQGYVVVRVGVNRVEREHRIVAEKMLGRPLADGEVVHHKNGNRQDNRPENLEVLPSQSDHMRHHMTTDEARRRGRRGNDARYGRLAALAALAPPRASSDSPSSTTPDE